ncbi:MAG: hypothetical protein K2X87_28360 [Gemmataceae bacterium]|nr:hypothetical protein [Gemmataceae bacterium]
MGLPETDPPARPAAAAVLVAYLALLFYGLGAGLLEQLLNYPMWRDMGARMADADFTATRRDHLWRIVPLLVIPVALRFPATVFLLARRPAFVPRWAVLVALACQAVGWASSALIQIPIQSALTDHGYSDALLDRLIVTDFWLRVLPSVVEAGVGLFLLRRVAARLA